MSGFGIHHYIELLLPKNVVCVCVTKIKRFSAFRRTQISLALIHIISFSKDLSVFMNNSSKFFATLEQIFAFEIMVALLTFSLDSKE